MKTATLYALSALLFATSLVLIVLTCTGCATEVQAYEIDAAPETLTAACDDNALIAGIADKFARKHQDRAVCYGGTVENGMVCYATDSGQRWFSVVTYWQPDTMLSYEVQSLDRDPFEHYAYECRCLARGGRSCDYYSLN